MSYKEKMEEIKNQLHALIEKIKEEMPTNLEHPGVNRLGKRAFTIQSSELNRGNWTAEYHDWPWQCEKLIEIMSQLKPDTFPEVLDRVFDTKEYKLGNHKIKFHPDLIIKVQNRLNWLTEKQTKDYLASSNQCPVCGEDLEGNDINIDAGSAWQNCSCLNPKCEALWQDIYKLVDVQLNN